MTNLDDVKNQLLTKIAASIEADNLERAERFTNLYGQLSSVDHCERMTDAQVGSANPFAGLGDGEPS